GRPDETSPSRMRCAPTALAGKSPDRAWKRWAQAHPADRHDSMSDLSLQNQLEIFGCSIRTRSGGKNLNKTPAFGGVLGDRILITLLAGAPDFQHSFPKTHKLVFVLPCHDRLEPPVITDRLYP